MTSRADGSCGGAPAEGRRWDRDAPDDRRERLYPAALRAARRGNPFASVAPLLRVDPCPPPPPLARMSELT